MSPRFAPRLVTALALAFALAATLASARTLVHCGTLIDGIGDTPRRAMTVVVDGERIVGVQPGYLAPAAGDKVIDLKSATVTPGWIDCHVHLTSEQSPARYTEGFFMNPADYALRATGYVRKTLLAGVTSVCPKAAAIGPLIQATFQRAWQAGVKIAFGTDQGVGPHGDNALEFVFMTEAGMPPMAAFKRATIEAAKLLVALPGDPLADLSLVMKVSFVMKDGGVHKQ